MYIEEIFQKAKVNKEKLIEYGFIKKDDNYYYSKKIMNGDFKVDIIINEKEINSKVFDLSFNEEYTNFKIEKETGSFVNSIRDEYKNILIDIREKCFESRQFVTDQACRIADSIKIKYNVDPEFAWEKFQTDAIFKNNDKWFGLIMNIDRRKLENKDGNIDVINVKLSEQKIQKLLKKEGFYKAYHMNKEKWITIILDGTISDEEIMEYISESYLFTEKSHNWLVPANPNYYDIINCFNSENIIEWKQPKNIKVGDIVYIYISKPYAYIAYKCEVVKIDIPYDYQDKNLKITKVMLIKLLKKYNSDDYSLEKLNKYGIKVIRAPRSMPDNLCQIIENE